MPTLPPETTASRSLAVTARELRAVSFPLLPTLADKAWTELWEYVGDALVDDLLADEIVTVTVSLRRQPS